MINYKHHRKAIEKTYEDKVSISRYEKFKVGGETKHELHVIYKDQPCRLSQKALGSNNQSDAQNDITYETKLFISPDLEILQGDEIEVTKGTMKRKYTAGEPFIYQSHQEVTLSREDYA
ncbi:ABC transporter ATP-binding protein [Bacillus chungangensis]|uniref:ABC transporter ATP-binding protein n=1 Tax=Bacillus chungangensis TaxID=587633 RepID=A0ABT9WRS2_9BACI|nr:ABC transporter ATP-binding protein [Bacillus chungangensis]MDQ0175993.1 hypothetical protein [Bacillus chungangensis]